MVHAGLVVYDIMSNYEEIEEHPELFISKQTDNKESVYFSTDNDLISKLLYDEDLASIKFMIDTIYGTTSLSAKKLKSLLPKYAATNFPSQEIFSNLLNSLCEEKNIDTTENYDLIRKCLILLNFYYFWCQIKVGRDKRFSNESRIILNVRISYQNFYLILTF